MKNIFLSAIFFVCAHFVTAQNFEGYILYKAEVANPNPQMIPDSVWTAQLKEQFGEKGYMIQKYFYKGENYISHIEAGAQKGFQAFNPKNKLIYAWQENSDTAITLDSRKYMDEIVEIKHLDATEEILGITCQSLSIKSKFGEMTLWYNRDHLKMDPKLYKGHKYGHYDKIIEEIGCMPLKISIKGFMMNMTQTAMEYKQMAVESEMFEIPKFKEVIANPIN